jgi:nucleoside-diphosphate-sugar epimerase
MTATKLIIGCGYLGSRVAAVWRSQGQRVIATTRRPERAAELAGLGIEPLICDVLAPTSLRGLPPFVTVLYCVGLDRTAGSTIREVYVDGLRNVLACLEPTRRFLHISSTSVYGQCAGEEVAETAPTIPTEEAGQVVLAAEQVVWSCPWAKNSACILRFAGIYGPGRLMRRQSLMAGEPLLGDPERWLNLIHVDDGVAAVLLAEAGGCPGEVYNVSDGHPVRRLEFASELTRSLQAPPPRFEPLQPGQPVPAHEKNNRRIVNGKLCQLGFVARFPTFREGLPTCLVI